MLPRTLRRLPLLALIPLVLMVGGVLAQPNCPALVQEALQDIVSNCTGLDRNAACYGHDRVDATFVIAQPEGTFNAPSDVIGLRELETLQTHPLDVDNGEFGAALMNVQANVPNSLPGQGVLFLIVGDSDIRNAVDPNAAMEPTDPITLTLTGPATLYSAPSETASTRRSAAAGEALDVDGVTPQRLWVRVVDGSGVAWVRISDLPPSAALNALPTVGSSQRTPMQAFYFRTGLGAPVCEEAAPVIAVQSPENLTIDLTLNGVDIRVGSLITFRSLSEQQGLLTVHRGSVQTSSGPTLLSNQSSLLQLNQTGGIASFGPPQPISDEDYQRGLLLQATLNALAAGSGWQTYELPLLESPTPTSTPTFTPTPESATTGDGSGGVLAHELTHVVQRGDTLFSIARQYEANMQSIVTVNGLTNPCVIRVGQVLRIPDAGSGFVGIPNLVCNPTPTPSPTPDAQPGEIDDDDAPIAQPRYDLQLQASCLYYPDQRQQQQQQQSPSFEYKVEVNWSGVADEDRVTFRLLEIGGSTLATGSGLGGGGQTTIITYGAEPITLLADTDVSEQSGSLPLRCQPGG